MGDDITRRSVIAGIGAAPLALAPGTARAKDLVTTERGPGLRTRIFTEYDIVGGPTVTAHLAVDKAGRVVGAVIDGTTDPREAELVAYETARMRFDPDEPRYFTPQERQRFLERPVRETWSEHHGPVRLGKE